MSATIGTKIFTFFQGRHVGTDEFGNRYYEARRALQGRHRKRWVIYNGQPEASKVPPYWHGWLHYTLAAPLEATPKYRWQKKHQPNLTGTTGRYLPAGHISKAGQRAPATADYQPWTPGE